jgi:hypothetical protein
VTHHPALAASSGTRVETICMSSELQEKTRLEFVPLSQDLVAACHRFNGRLAPANLGGEVTCVPNSPGPQSGTPQPMENQRFVAIDASGEIRGAYQLRWQYFWLDGSQFLGAAYGFPVSEGMIDKRYAMLGVGILRDALKRCECLYTLGAGGADGHVFRVAKHAGWQIHDVPFLFKIIHAARFTRLLPQLHTTAARRALAQFGAATGLAQLAASVLQLGSAARTGRLSSSSRRVSVERVYDLSAIADEIWLRVRSSYRFCVVRDAAHLSGMYPLSRRDLHLLAVRHAGELVGWAVVMTENLSRLRVYLGYIAPGLIVDAFGDPSFSREIVSAAASYLADQNVDVILTNESHQRWIRAYKSAGFLTRPSQFPFISSRALSQRLAPLPEIISQSHLCRGDGDGVHYLA